MSALMIPYGAMLLVHNQVVKTEFIIAGVRNVMTIDESQGLEFFCAVLLRGDTLGEALIDGIERMIIGMSRSKGFLLAG